MTLLERLQAEYDSTGAIELYAEEWADIARALAIAQAVDEEIQYERDYPALYSPAIGGLKKRADEILAALKEGK